MPKPAPRCHFFVPGKVVPWSVSRRGTKSKELSAFQGKVQIFAKQAGAVQADTTMAIYLRLDFVLPEPTMTHYWYPKRKDLTNLQKAVEDALSGICYRDDSQVVQVAARMRFPVGDEDVGVHVEVVAIRQPRARTGGYKTGGAK